MPTTIAARRLEFVRVPPSSRGTVPDVLDTGKVTLDPNAGTFAVRIMWRPTCETWYLDLRSTSGTPIVLGAAVRDRVDCLLGVSTPGRPRGAIMSYDPKGRGNPTALSFADGVVGLWYVPAGLDPYDFALYQTEVV